MKKLGSKLTTGDVVTLTYEGDGPMVPPPLRLLIVRLSTTAPGTSSFQTVTMHDRESPITNFLFKNNQEYDVEAPAGAVTPDELRDLVTAARMVVGSDMPHPGRLVELVDRLDPPAPPTLQEALEALVNA